MNRFQRAQARLNQRFMENAKVTIVYHRLDFFLPIDVWVGNTLFRSTDQGATRLEWGDRDYLIPVVNLKIDGLLVEPQKDDWIEEEFPEPHGVQSFMIVAPDNEPVWRFSDNQRTLYRVHTKRIKN